MFLVRVLLLPFSFLYGLITSVRNVLFNSGVLKSREFQTKSISVGNITVGGTGKTPVVERFTKELMTRGRKVAILSRGYKSKEGKPKKSWSNFFAKALEVEPSFLALESI